MSAAKIFLATVLLVVVTARHVPWEEVPYGYDEDYRYPKHVDQDYQYTQPGNSHSLTVMKESIPGFGSKLSAGAHATVFNENGHNVGLNAFAAKNTPTHFPGAPNFNTIGGGVDYMFKNKIGGSFDIAHTPFLERKDYSAMGNYNVFRSPTGCSSVGFSAVFKRTDSPAFSTGWKPNFLLTFGKSF